MQTTRMKEAVMSGRL